MRNQILRGAGALLSAGIACAGPNDPAQTDGPTASSAETSTESGEPGTSFNEDGAWSLVAFDLGDGVEDVMSTTRNDAFLLHFDSAARVMTTAACGDEMYGFGPSDSLCRLAPTTTEWQCRCFSYAFQGDIMQLVEFDPGGPAPMVEFDPDPSVDGSVTVASVALLPERADTFEIRPLPDGVFGGGAESRFIVEARAMATFDETHADPEGRDSCAPCVL